MFRRAIGGSMKMWLALAGWGAVVSASAGSSQVFTGPAGGDQPFDNMQSYVAVTQLITTNGLFPPSTPTPNETFTASHYLGMLRTLGGSQRPGNSAYADGSIYPISLQTAGLFSLLGFNYGGDGATNFALPDLGGRTIIGTARARF